MSEPLSAIHVNRLTARPLLELLLAQLEYETGYLFPGPVWPVFLWWAALPVQHEDGGASFQVTIESEGPDGVLLTASILREITDPTPSLADDNGTESRQIGIQWSYVLTGPGPLVERDVWASDFESLEAFAANVSAMPEWAFVTSQVAIHDAGTVVTVYPE